jgi:hypothetical protein
MEIMIEKRHLPRDVTKGFLVDGSRRPRSKFQVQMEKISLQCGTSKFMLQSWSLGYLIQLPLTVMHGHALCSIPINLSLAANYQNGKSSRCLCIDTRTDAWGFKGADSHLILYFSNAPIACMCNIYRERFGTQKSYVLEMKMAKMVQQVVTPHIMPSSRPERIMDLVPAQSGEEVSEGTW